MSETMPLNEWDNNDLLKLECVIEMAIEKGYLPLEWKEWGDNVLSAVIQARKDSFEKQNELPY